MGESTHIQWCDDTHNFWRGCTKVSAGCKNCYAETIVTTRLASQHYDAAIASGKWHPEIGGHRSSAIPLWGPGAPRARSRDFNAPLRWNKKPWVCDVCGGASDRHYDHSCTGKREDACHTDNVTWHRRRVFCLSLGDWLDDEVPIEWLADLLDVIRRCPNLDFLLLTKRPENWQSRVGKAYASARDDLKNVPLMDWTWEWLHPHKYEPPSNVWFGVSAEDQKRWDERREIAEQIPASIRFVSYEPALESVRWNWNGKWHWWIAGGESGPKEKVRPCNIDWIREGVRQCQAAGVATFVKQLGANPYCPGTGFDWTCAGWPHCPELDGSNIRFKDKKGGDPTEWPEDLRVREFPNPENVLRATPTDCGREAACGKCDVCKYLEFIEHAQSVAPPESTIQRNYEIEQYISRTYPAH